MKKHYLFPIGMALILTVQTAAQNVVTNGDFSIKEGPDCPSSTGFQEEDEDPEIWNPLAWDDTTHDNQNTPDYYHPCNASGTAYSPGDNHTGCADPLSGSAYVGFEVYRSNLPSTNPEYIHQQL